MIQEWFHIVTDPAHVLGEVTFAAVEGLILTPVITLLVRRHDRKKHNVRKDNT